MIRTSILVATSFGLAGVPSAWAQDSIVPVGVIIYDEGSSPVGESTVVDAAPIAVTPAEIPPAISEPVVTTPVEFAPLPATPSSQSLASTRSSSVVTPVAVPAGTMVDPTVIAPQVDLAPGESVLQGIAGPSVVKVPAVQPTPAYTMTSTPPPARLAPEPVIDPVSGRLRDTAGWTGRYDNPASIGCFPEGSCAVLNAR